MVEPALAAGEGIEIVPTPDRLIPLIVLFVLMIVPVNRLILRPLLGVLEEREERIAGARVRADALRREADAVLSGYQARIADARAESELERRGTLDEARGRNGERVREARGAAETRIATARREVGTALEQARSQLRAQSDALARQVAERMLGRSL